MSAVVTRGEARGFTLAELLVASALLLVIAALVSRPLMESAQALVRVRDRSEAARENLAFLDLIEGDIRAASYIAEASANRVAIYRPGSGDTVAWEIAGLAAIRTVGERSVRFSIAAENLVLAGREPAPATRYVLIAGDFEGIGRLERGVALGLE